MPQAKSDPLLEALTMLQPIFGSEINGIQSQIAQLQAQLAALTEAQVVADGAIQALQGAVEQVTALAPNAINAFKQNVLSLFNSGGDSNDDGGNHPINPALQPSDDGGEQQEFDEAQALPEKKRRHLGQPLYTEAY